MRVGVVFPQIEIGSDRGAVRAYAEAVDGLGYAHLLAYDHVVGADPAVHTRWRGPYSISDTFHEPMVLFGYLAAFTRLELVTGILIAPQRQTVLIAKQAAEVDVLTGGRFRLGIGLGWNRLEYEALGQEFSERSRRVVEQIELLRALWTDESVTFEGRSERLRGVGILPMPVQRPIPVWMGGMAAPALRRIGRIADGWFPRIPVEERGELEAAIGVVQGAAAEAGRPPVPFEGRITVTPGLGGFAAELAGWRELGAVSVTLDTMRQGHRSVEGHIGALTEAAAIALGA